MPRSIRRGLEYLGQASPIVPPTIYVVATVAANLLGTFWGTNVVAGLVALLLWCIAFLGLWIVVTWFRDDDALAAGFLIGISIIVAGPMADVLVGVVRTGSFGAAIFEAAASSLRVLVRAVLLVPISAGIVWMLRRISQLVRGRASARPAPPV